MSFEDKVKIKAPVLQVDNFKLELEGVGDSAAFCLKTPKGKSILRYSRSDSNESSSNLLIGEGTNSVNFATNSLQINSKPIEVLWGEAITDASNSLLQEVQNLIPSASELSSINSAITNLDTRISTVETGLTEETSARTNSDNSIEQAYENLVEDLEGNQYRLLQSNTPNITFADIIGVFVPYSAILNETSYINAITLENISADTSFWVSVYKTSGTGTPSTNFDYELATQSSTEVDIINGNSTQAIFNKNLSIPATDGGFLFVFHSDPAAASGNSISWLTAENSSVVRLSAETFKYNLQNNDWTKSNGIGLLQMTGDPASMAFSQAAIPNLTLYMTGHVNNLDIHMPWNSIKTYIQTATSAEYIQSIVRAVLESADTTAYINQLIEQKLNSSN